MSMQPNKRNSLEEYFELERNSPEKNQYLDGVIFPIGEPPPRRAIRDSDPAHCLIIGNVQTTLQHCLNGRRAVV